MSKTSNTKQITKIIIDEANGLTHVYMSDLSPKIIKANTTAPTNIPTKSEFSFRDESEESSAVVEKAFDEVFPEVVGETIYPGEEHCYVVCNGAKLLPHSISIHGLTREEAVARWNSFVLTMKSQEK